MVDYQQRHRYVMDPVPQVAKKAACVAIAEIEHKDHYYEQYL